jgi:hypothetical protein
VLQINTPFRIKNSHNVVANVGDGEAKVGHSTGANDGLDGFKRERKLLGSVAAKSHRRQQDCNEARHIAER